jgi:3-phenylpropionate/trans-cinnamate dioxygenase ferredoxin subunit
MEDFLIGPVAEFPEGSKQILELGGRSVGIYHTKGEFYAVHNVCPHALAPICVSDLTDTRMPSAPGEFVAGMENLVLRCPWHAWEFDVRTGEALFGTDRRRLLTFPIRVEDGQIIVSLRARKKPLPPTIAAGPTAEE